MAMLCSYGENIISVTEISACQQASSRYTGKPLQGKYIYYAEGGGMKMLRGGTEIFSGLKGGALKVLDILKGGSKLFKVLAPANSS